ncbi:MAG: type II toxin-antitoxin system VapC family toxin [Armatimonadota bacterium]|nr:type II toxin-antitoxin system VapC family toxin [Armatimonadota bacterium]
MALTEIPTGSEVFVDANVFIYHFAGRSADCTALLARIEQGGLRGLTGPFEVLEVAHRLMMLEAVELGMTARPSPAAQLARRPDLVRRLSKYYFSIMAIPRMGLEVLPLPPDFMSASQEFRQSHGLRVGDSLVVMHMRQAGVSVLASADEAFDRVPGIRRFGPADV